MSRVEVVMNIDASPGSEQSVLGIFKWMRGTSITRMSSIGCERMYAGFQDYKTRLETSKHLSGVQDHRGCEKLKPGYQREHHTYQNLTSISQF